MEILLGLLIVAIVLAFFYTRRTKDQNNGEVAQTVNEPVTEVKPVETPVVAEPVKVESEPVKEEPKPAAKKPKATKSTNKKVVQMPKKPAAKKPKTQPK